MSEQLKETVRKAYKQVAESGPGCGCGPNSGSLIHNTIDQNWTLSESYSQAEGYEEDADYALGC